MLRFRRYRVFLIFAALATLLIIRFTHSRNSLYHPRLEKGLEISKSPPKKDGGQLVSPPVNTPPPVQKEKPKEVAEDKHAVVHPTITSSVTKVKVIDLPTEIPPKTALLPKIPQFVLPDRKPIPPTRVWDDDDTLDEIHPVSPPGRQDLPVFSAVPTTIHWQKQVENWPIPTADLIKLPQGQGLKIPKIQHAFDDETSDAKISREKRQTKVRDEFKRAWNGYKEKAWLHDELSPVSGKFRDPFCGWAATLVDTLDTLWIMGLEEEFEEAARAVDLIDFTTSGRSEIPMFETTIRYLGGLLAAYDVSGAKYKNLLTKAVELAEILMGAFDTPNRMPQLYYRWKPAFASQPHRASQRSNLAELGSLSMEFTRLAQITKDPKYYDAVARVTNALAEWQEKGTNLDGVFPDNVDASGCNRTDPNPAPFVPVTVGSSISPAHVTEEPVGFRPVSPETVKEPIPIKQNKGKLSGPGTLELQVMDGAPGKAIIIGWDDEPKLEGLKQKRQLDGELSALNKSSTATPTTDTVTGLPLDIPAAKKLVGEFVGDWDCHPQGLTSASQWGSEKFSMGGGQDSTYEYFPKQYLLLGGLEDKYRKMYLKTIAAVRKHMIYRPMLPDNRDILFSGSVSTYGNAGNGVDDEPKLSADVEHLTCFVGGMVGLGAKIFGIEADLEIAKKLTDGCVWAYESTASGIMPEGAIVMPCEKVDNCVWNQTAYYQFLDPQWNSRDQQVIDYEIEKAKRLKDEAEQKVEAARVAAEEERKAAEEKVLMDDKAKDPTVSDFMQDESSKKKTEDPSVSDFLNDRTAASTHDLDTTDPAGGSAALKKDAPVSLQKRQLDDESTQKEIPKVITHDFRDYLPNPGAKEGHTQHGDGTHQDSYNQRAKYTEHELKEFAQSGRPAERPLIPTKSELPPDPMRPNTHSEYIAELLAQEPLPPGYVSIRSKKYILRPEAIESVWYMYRITGDKIWQDKGWKMFESIIRATSTTYGHTAIYDVMIDKPYPADEMESFWLAETLKYFYLLYSTPDTISLDEWVLNTEAHPFKRPT